MIGFVRAFVWFRWRVLVNTLHGSRRRDRLERLARIGALVSRVFGAVLMIVPVTALSVLGLVGGIVVGSGTVPAAPVLLALRGMLLGALALLILVPMGRAAHGGATGEVRFLLLPIRRGMLHLVEVVAGLGDPWVAIFIPPQLLFPLGLALAGRGAPAAIAALAGLVHLAVLAAVASTLTFSMQWLFKDRRRAETVTIVAVVALSSLGMVSLFVDDWIGGSAGEPEAGRITVERFNRSLPAWTRVMPSELYGAALGSALERRWGWSAAALLALALEATLLYRASTFAHERALTVPETSRARRRRATGSARALRIPGLSPGAVAVAGAHLRVVLRSVRGKLAVYPVGPMILVSGWALGGIVARKAPLLGAVPLDGHLVLWFGALIAILSLQPVLFNQFAADRGGLTLQLLAPLSERDLVLGKAVASAALIGITLALVLVAAIVLAPHGSPLLWVAALAGCAALSITLVPVATILSVLFPKPADLNRMGKAGNPHGLASFLGFVLTIGLATPAALLGAIGLLFLGPLGALALNLAWALVGGVSAWLLFRGAARLVDARRESLALAAQES